MANNIQVRDASGNALTVATLDAGGVHTPVNQITSIQKNFRENFTGNLTDNWQVTTVSGATAVIADGVLTLASGVTPTAYAELLSKETFTIPFRVIAAVQSGARQLNTHHILELVSVDPVTGIPDGKSAMSFNVGGANGQSVTQAIYEVQASGLRPLVSGASTIVSTNTYSLLEMEPFTDEAYFHSRNLDSTGSRSNSYVRHQQIPHPNAVYKLRIRSHNIGVWRNITGAIAGTAGVVRLTSAAHGYLTGNVIWVEGLLGIRGNYVVTVVDANTFELNSTVFAGSYVSSTGRCANGQTPAAAVNWQFQFVGVTDFAELTAEITGGRGQAAGGQSIGVQVNGGGVTTYCADNVFWNESATNLAVFGSLFGATRDVGVSAGNFAARSNRFRAFSFSDQAGMLRIECSNDNVTWRRATLDVTTVANTPLILEIPVMTRYHRVFYLNGANAQTMFMLNSAYTAA